MIIFANSGAEHLINKMSLPKGRATLKKFSDGEIYVKIESDIKNKKIWVIASTQAPAQNLIELFFLLDALSRLGASGINLFFPYFGYARQAIAHTGQAASAQLICTILKQFPLGTVNILHVHAAPRMHNFLNFENVIDLDFFCNAATEYDCIAAPDKGAATFAQKVAHTCKKEAVFLQKIRPDHEYVKIESITGTVVGKKILLVDDIISTGRTMIEAANALINAGAQEVAAAATHGIFTNGAHERFAQSTIKKIFVTNSLKDLSSHSIQVYDESGFIEKLISQGTY